MDALRRSPDLLETGQCRLEPLRSLGTAAVKCPNRLGPVDHGMQPRLRDGRDPRVVAQRFQDCFCFWIFARVKEHGRPPGERHAARGVRLSRRLDSAIALRLSVAPSLSRTTDSTISTTRSRLPTL